MTLGFDNDLYVKEQREAILSRIADGDERLYLEFGGKLFDDCHAARVLPGFDVNAKVKLLQTLSNQAEIIITVNSKDLEKNKIRADHGINYGLDVLRLIDKLRGLGIVVNCVVITQYQEQTAADIFRKKLERRGERVYVHFRTKGYPMDIDMIISDEGYGKNPYIECSRPLVVVAAPGPGSGKLATCLCQLYHEFKRGARANYAKFETFPVWNLPLKHPVNIAYEAATADLKDVNMVDIYHMQAYDKLTVNYNRDIEVFPVVRSILEKITGTSPYKSPTDMGVNMVGFAITDDMVCEAAAKQEVIRRYFKASCDYIQGTADIATAEKIELLMSELQITVADRKCVGVAIAKATEKGMPAVAIELQNGSVVTGRQGKHLSAAAAAVLNAVKLLAGISDEIDLISPIVIEPIIKMKRDIMDMGSDVLSLEEILIALSICAATNPVAELALKKLALLSATEAHSSCILKKRDALAFARLNVRLTMQPEFESANLFNE